MRVAANQLTLRAKLLVVMPVTITANAAAASARHVLLRLGLLVLVEDVVDATARADPLFWRLWRLREDKFGFSRRGSF